MKRVLQQIPDLNLTSYYHELDEPGCDPLIIVERVVHDVEPIMDVASIMRNETSGQTFGEMRHVASIPINLYMQGMMEGWARDESDLKKWINDRDHSRFKTFDKKI
jgi:hypothetical protein